MNNEKIRTECCERLRSLGLPKADKIFEAGGIPIWETYTGRVYRDDAFSTDKVRSVKTVYHRTPYLILKIEESTIGYFYMFCSVSETADYWKQEKSENYIDPDVKIFNFIAPAYFPREKRYTGSELLSGSLVGDHCLDIVSISAAERASKPKPQRAQAKHKGGKKHCVSKSKRRSFA